MLEAFGAIKLLLTNGEDEIQPTITTGQSLVAQRHGESPFL
jgi:hypothetical protein